MACINESFKLCIIFVVKLYKSVGFGNELNKWPCFSYPFYRGTTQFIDVLCVKEHLYPFLEVRPNLVVLFLLHLL